MVVLNKIFLFINIYKFVFFVRIWLNFILFVGKSRCIKNNYLNILRINGDKILFIYLKFYFILFILIILRN